MTKIPNRQSRKRDSKSTGVEGDYQGVGEGSGTGRVRHIFACGMPVTWLWSGPGVRG